MEHIARVFMKLAQQSSWELPDNLENSDGVNSKYEHDINGYFKTEAEEPGKITLKVVRSCPWLS